MMEQTPHRLCFRFSRQPGETATQFRARVISALDDADVCLPDDFEALMQANVGGACVLNIMAVAALGPLEAIFCRRTLH